MQPAGCFHSRSRVRLNHELALARCDEDANSSARAAAWFPPALIYPKKRGVRYNVEFAKMLFSTSRKMAFIGWGSSGNGSSNNEAISIRLFAGVTRARSSPPYNRNTSSDAFRKSSRNVSKSESRLVPSAELCLVISHASLPNFLPRPYRLGNRPPHGKL